MFSVLDSKTKRKEFTHIMKNLSIKFISIFISVTMLAACLFPVYANEPNPEHEVANDYSTQTELTSTSTEVAVAPIEDGGIYAIYNIGAAKWASTAYSSSTVDTHNLFQYSNWTSTAQNFRFVSAGRSGVDTYIIYPLEYGNNNADEARALYCDYSQIEGVNPVGVNVLPATFLPTDMESFEWLVSVNSDGSFTIGLYADQRYILSANATGNGSVTTTGVTETGNIIARRTTNAAPNSKQKWNLRYAIQNGTYYFMNRAMGNFLYSPSNSFATVSTNGLDFSTTEVWNVQHMSNGRYFVNHQSSGTLCIGSAAPMEYSGVYAEPNMAQTRFQWTIQQTANGSFILQNAVADSEGNYYVLKGQASSLLSAAYIGAYVDDEIYLDEWYICDATIGKYANFFLGQGSGDTLMPGLLSEVKQIMTTQAKMPGFGYTSTSKATYLNMLDNVDMFVHVGIGENVDYIQLYNGGLLGYHEIDQNVAAGAYSNLKIVLLASCYSSGYYTNASSLAKSIKNKGAQTVVGFYSTIDIETVNIWIPIFMECFADDMTVREAMTMSSEEVVFGNSEGYNVDFFESYVIHGSGSTSLYS